MCNDAYVRPRVEYMSRGTRNTVRTDWTFVIASIRRRKPSIKLPCGPEIKFPLAGRQAGQWGARRSMMMKRKSQSRRVKCIARLEKALNDDGAP